MTLPIRIALRYLGNRSPLQFFRSPNAINLLTLVSLLAVAIITMASIIILSTFNGLMSLVGDLNSQFDSDLKVLPITGKVFVIDSLDMEEINSLPGVVAHSKVLEETVLFDYNGNQVIGTVKGVEQSFTDVTNLPESLVRGQFKLKDSLNYGVLGLGVANRLAINLRNPFDALTIYIPKRKQRVSFNPSAMMGSTTVKPIGEFAIQRDYDDKYVFVPIEIIRPLLSYENEISALELRIEDGRVNAVKKEIASLLGEEVEVLDRYQQNKSWYKVMRFEKWAAFSILALIMLIASFNMVSSLSMMVIDKKKDISVLKSMGLSNRQVGSVFRWQGILIGVFGALFGGLLAVLIILAQQQFGLVKMEGNFVVDNYPVTLRFFDVFLVVSIIIVISYLAAYFPSIQAERQKLVLSE